MSNVLEILCVLYLSQKEMSTKELAQETGLTLTQMYSTLQFMRNSLVVKRRKVSRETFYIINPRPSNLRACEKMVAKYIRTKNESEI